MAVARDETTVLEFDDSQSSESAVFQFEKVLGMIEWLGLAAQRHWGEWDQSSVQMED